MYNMGENKRYVTNVTMCIIDNTNNYRLLGQYSACWMYYVEWTLFMILLIKDGKIFFITDPSAFK